MTDYNVTVGKELLPELLSGQDGLAKLIESVLNKVLDAQVLICQLAFRIMSKRQIIGRS